MQFLVDFLDTQQHVAKEHLDWLVAVLRQRDEWNSATIINGEQFVMTVGEQMMQGSSVDSLDILQVVSYHRNYSLMQVDDLSTT